MIDVKKEINEKKIITICRKVYGKDIHNLSEALYKGGVTLLEVTFDQVDPDGNRKTAETINTLIKSFPEMSFGAGTVLTVAQVHAAHDAGAQFIISPNTDTEIIRESKKLGMLSIPGSMTPTEIMTAVNAGADYVKLFPCSYLGTQYVKEVLAPLSQVKLIGTGGITLENASDFLKVGIRGFGIGSFLCNKKLISEGNFKQIEENARMFADIITKHNKEAE